MGQQFIYDEKGSTFLYFLLSFFAMLLIPITYLIWPKSSKDEEKRIQNLCHIHGKSKWYKKMQDEFQRKKKRPSLRKIFLLFCWIGFIILVAKVSTIENDYVEYDPYHVLGVDREATPIELKKRFRQLSLENHPDKGGDPETFMKIRKAYEALTDEEARENWKTYGNPDGPRAVEVGIALPKWMVESQNSIFVLGFYVLVFMVIMPIIVGVWWNRSIKYSKEQVLLHTTQLYYHFLGKTPNMVVKRALMILSASFEFSRDYTTKVRAPAPSDNVELPELMRTLERFSVTENSKERPMNFPYSVKARTLMYCHLCRVDLPSKILEEDLEYILTKSSLLIQEMVSCISQLTSLAHWNKATMPRLNTLENVMKLSPMMVQGLREAKSPLLQLPYFNDEFVRNCQQNKRRPIKGLTALACMNDYDRRQMLRRMGDEEYDTMVAMLNMFPNVKLYAAASVKDDEEANVITAGSLVTVTARLNRRGLGDSKKEDLSKEVDDDPDVDEPHERPNNKSKPWLKKKTKKFSKTSKKNQKKAKGKSGKNALPLMIESAGSKDDDHSADEKGSSASENENEESVQVYDNEELEEKEWKEMQEAIKQEKAAVATTKQTHTVYAPMFPVEKQEWWWAYVCDRKNQLLLTNPILVANLVDTTEVELNFPAPQKPGRYVYTVCLKSDSYFDCDRSSEIRLDVKAAKEVKDHPQWNISDEEDNEKEDSEDEGISSEDQSSSAEE